MKIPSRRDIFALAWPLALDAVMLHSIVVIDAFLVSALGEKALAAMGLAASVGGLMLGVVFAFCKATQILIAQAYGADDPVALKSAFWCGLFINIAATAGGLALIVFLGDNIITAFSPGPEITADALRYLSIFTIVIVSEAVGQCLSCYFNGCGRTRLPFFSYLITMPVNVVLSVVLIHGVAGAPELGLMGAAVGSAVAAFVRAAFLGWWMLHLNSAYMNVPGWSRGDVLASTLRHLVFALPIATTFISLTLANSVCSLLYARLSISQFTAMTLITPWVQVAGQMMIAWTQAGGILIGQLLGNRTPETDIDVFLQQAWLSAFLVGGLVAATYLVIGLSFPWIYSDLQYETMVSLLSFLPSLLLLTFPKCSNAVCGSTLRAGGDTVYVMNIYLVSQWLFRVPLTALFVLVFDLSATWVFAIFLLEELIKFPPFHLRLRAGRWKRNLGER